jgi:catechol 2,3-dioxygenase-like lactoylglutathione lyase family enzyme
VILKTLRCKTPAHRGGADSSSVVVSAFSANVLLEHHREPHSLLEVITMQVGGILETALHVADPSQSAGFYRRLFGFDVLLESEQLVALNVAGRNVLLLFREGATSEPFAVEGGVIPPHGGSGPLHLAFSIVAEDVEPWRRRLESEGVAVESVVNWPDGGQSLYFRDPDGHLVELATPGVWSIY